MYRNRIKTIDRLILLIVAFTSFSAFSDTCDSIQCDCSALPEGDFLTSCMQREAFLKKSCTAKSSDKVGFCAIHGANAFPVSVATVAMPDVSFSTNIKDDNRKIASLYWSIREDVNFSSGSFEALDYQGAANIVKISNRNLDALYEIQNAVVNAWIDADRVDKSKSSWKNYGSDTLKLAKRWASYSDKVSQAAQAKRDGALLNLAVAVADISARIYEQAGLESGFADRHKSAATSWRSASEMSSKTIRLLEKYNSNVELISDYKTKTAARLHRASYHWVLNGNEDDAEELEEKSLEYASNELLKNEILSD